MEAARGEAAEHRVADGANTRLDRARILRQTAGGDLLLEEFDDVHADGPGRLGIGLELLRLVTAVRENDRRDLLRRARDVRSADTVVRLRDRDDARMRRQADLEDVVHTDQALRERLIDLHDDLIGIAHSRVCTPAGSGQVQALLAHRRTFYHSHVDFGTGMLIHVHGKMRDVHITVADRAGVDGIAQVLMRLVGVALFDQAGAHHCPVDLVADGGADADGQVTRVAGAHQCLGNGLRIADAGKAAHANGHAGPDQLCRLVRGHDFAFQEFRYSFHGFLLIVEFVDGRQIRRDPPCRARSRTAAP